MQNDSDMVFCHDLFQKPPTMIFGDKNLTEFCRQKNHTVINFTFFFHQKRTIYPPDFQKVIFSIARVKQFLNKTDILDEFHKDF